MPLSNSSPVIRMTGATVENVTSPDDGILWEKLGEEMQWVEFHEIAVDALRTVFPDIGQCPWVAGDDLFPLLLDDGKEALPFLGITALCGALLPPEAFMLRIALTLADNAHQSKNAAAVLRVSRHRCASELPGWKNAKVIALPVPSLLGTGRAAGDDLAARITDLLQAGEIEAGVSVCHGSDIFRDSFHSIHLP